ncbi:hypothetical protein [Ulvibacterium sp.]|uniref:hypothetical protein n=1 Tax=Ulvibacterium sp. TaxID=2665914 RepID=UPI003CC60562
MPEKVKVIGRPFSTEKAEPTETVLPPVKLIRMLPAGRPHLELISMLVAERLPSMTPPGNPKSEGDTTLNSGLEHPEILAIS